MSLKALQRRNFSVKEADEANGVIVAASKNGILKPGIQMMLKFSQDNEKQSSLSITSKIKRKWLSPQGYDESEEARFIRTLYNCIDTA